MALRGDLAEFSLDEVLRSLAATVKTGCLHVEGELGRGRVWLEDGALVGAQVQGARPGMAAEEVLFELLRHERGTFAFRADEPVPSPPAVPLDLDIVLDGARELLDEWISLRAVVPSVDHHVVLRSTLEAEAVTIDSRTWSTLQAVGGGRTVVQLANLLDVGEIEGVRRVRDLLSLGVATLVTPVEALPNRRRGA